MASWQDIERNPKFEQLVSKRKSLGWTLSAIMLAIYMGFICLVSFAPGSLGIPMIGVITSGVIIGVLVILSAFVLTGIYVQKANVEYDSLTKAIIEESK
ncbi:MAG: DUF485 domain-containing protein [Beijerinckiaceae bacterium]